MKLRRRTARLGVALAAGVGLGLLTPALPVFGQTTPTSRCQEALLNAQSRVHSVSSQSLPVGAQSALLGVQSRLADLSAICGQLPNVPHH